MSITSQANAKVTWPWNPTHLHSRGGGKIDTIHGMGHSHNDWWLICDVSYEGGGSNKMLQLHPGQVVYSGEGPDAKAAKAECDRMSEIVMDYLNEFGEWGERGQWKAKKRKAVRRA